jgi:hypothetical protein
MKSSLFLLFFTRFLFTGILIPDVEDSNAVRDLSWLAGCWEEVNGNRTAEEFRMKPEGQTMLGVARVIKNGKTVSFEYMRIIQTEAGADFIAQPSEQAQASFHLVSPISE